MDTMEKTQQKTTGGSASDVMRTSGAPSNRSEEDRGLFDQAERQVSQTLNNQKQRATDQLGGITTALHQTSRALRDQEQDTIAQYIDGAARQLDTLSDYLQHRTVGEMIGEGRRLARREPVLFLGGAMLLGLVGSRFFKSSTPDDRYGRDPRSRGSSDRRGQS